MKVVGYLCDVCKKPIAAPNELKDYGAIEIELTFHHLQEQRTADVCSKACLHAWVERELIA